MIHQGMATSAAAWLMLAGCELAADPKTSNWPSFRGPHARGVAEGHPTLIRWNVAESIGVKWKTPIPGLGHSAPVIWADRVFVTTAVNEEKEAELKVGIYGNIESVNDEAVHTWRVLCLDKRTGKILWQRVARKGVPKIKRHTKASHANSTPATDGRHVVAFFGSEGLYCFDLDGKLLWERDLGLLDSGYYRVRKAQWGFGSSPVIHKDAVILQCDVQENSFLVALSIADGSDIWRTPRDEVPTWSTPTIHDSNGRVQIIVNGLKHVGGYHYASGAELWKMKGRGDIPVPTPVVAGGLIYITNAHGAPAPIFAIRASALGDVSLPSGKNSNQHIAWSRSRGGAYMQTPLVYRGYLYVCTDTGKLLCLDAKTGKKAYQTRLGEGQSGFTASPVAADAKIYFTSEIGDIHVIAAGPQFKPLATNPMGETCMATPAISEGTLFFHTRHHLVAIADATP